MKTRLILALSIIALPVLLAEALEPAGIFSDHMVLQREMPVPLWGSAAPGENIELRFAGQSHKTKADASGNWKFVLSPMPASKEPREMLLLGESSGQRSIKDILIGEVWLCAGQSNMQWPFDAKHGVDDNEAVIAAADRPLIRHRNSGLAFKGKWMAVSPQAMPETSAVPYFFSCALQDKLDGVPLGIVNLAYSGTNLEAWTSKGTLAKTEWGRQLLDFAESQDVKDYRERCHIYYNSTLKNWGAEQAKGSKEPRPALDIPPSIKYYFLNDLYNMPGNFFDNAVLPVSGYALRGAAWYQGENNACPPRKRLEAYSEILQRMISEWRAAWGQGDFPFLCVQLPGYGRFAENGYEHWSYWAAVREQIDTVEKRTPATSMSVIFDTPKGDIADLHPRQKREVGERLALLALHDVYGKNLVARGPVFKSMRREGAKLMLHFENCDGGLSLRSNPASGFMIAGEDRRFVKAEVEIIGDELSISSQEVAVPVAVRYAWANRPYSTLFNGAGLPAAPFRTDAWPLPLGDIPVPNSK